MLLIDGVRYEEWVPEGPRAEDDFERMVSEHALEIFGEHSLYFGRKLKLQSLSGVGSIPDGYAIVIGYKYEWHIVEVELSSHPLYNHIVPQISRFISGINNPSTRKTIIEALYHALVADELNYFKMDKIIQSGEYYKFISDIVSNSPVITIIVEKDTPELHDALASLNHPKKNIVEFRTFVREGAEAVHAHLFEPLYKIAEKKSERVSETRETVTRIQREESGVPEIKVKITPASIKYGYIPFPKRNRLLFPGYDEPFTLVTDIGEITPHVTGARVGTQVGDLNAGNRIGKNLKPWYKKHRELQTGDEIIIKTIEPMKKYRLEIVK